MGENSPSTGEEKSISFLERFRKLKKEQEQPPNLEENPKTPEKTGTVFEASASSTQSLNGGFGSGGRRGRFYGKRNFQENSDERPSKRLAGDPSKGQKEPDCGITEFLREGPGFDVIIKSRYTDFQVNEIDPDGKVVKLTSTEIMAPNYNESQETTPEEDPLILPSEKWEAVRNIVDNKLSTTVEIDVTDMRKEQRIQIHKAVKRRFGVHIYSNTAAVDDKKIMKIGYASKSTFSGTRWPAERPEYLHFVLFKENCDTSESINVISKYTHIRATRFGYAGTKDKRSASTQWACVRRGDLKNFKTCDRLRGIAIGNFLYKWNNLRLGDLTGNRFKLVLRSVKASDEVIKDAVEQFEKVGFINYFGLQRFGNSAQVPTHAVGKAILKGDWKLAVELILKPRPREASYRDLAEARNIWWETRNATDALQKLYRTDSSLEGKMLMGLRKHGPNAYQNAFDNLPRQTGTMYLHAYQSLLWNKVVSRRVREFGLKVLPGDLVRLSSEASQQVKENENDSDEDEEDVPPELGMGRIQVRALTEQEAAEVSIYDVLLPLPGDDVRLPANQIAEWYNELLQADGFSMSSFSNVHKKYGMHGTYRPMLEKPGDVSWRTIHYSDPDQDLLQTDLAILRQEPPFTVDPEGPYKALVLEFNLKVCSYATMAVRELCKCDTSVSSQALLSQQVKEDYLARQERQRQPDNGDAMDVDEPEQQQPAVEPQQPTVKPQQLAAEPQQLAVEQQQTTVEPQQPAVEPQQPTVEPQQPTVEPQQPTVEPQQPTVEPQQPTVEPQQPTDEQGEMIKREAEADNIINKYLERNYH